MENKILILVISIIIALILIIFYLNLRLREEMKKESTQNIDIKDNTINLSSLTLRQKIAQIVIVRGDKEQMDFTNLDVGGIFLDRQKSEEAYKNLIENYQNNSKIKLFVSTDLEGTLNPFQEQELQFLRFSEIEDFGKAYGVGLKHGILLKEVGFNLNFAPVAEFSDKVYGGRVFKGTNEQIKRKIKSYIQGLQKSVMGTCKHYPGKAMEKNLHYSTDKQIISKQDLELFQLCIDNDISAIMVSHQIVEGELDSNGKPSSVSNEVIDNLDDFEGLIISDEVNMQGLKSFFSDKTKLYTTLINSGENVILDFQLSPTSLYKLIIKIEKEVNNGNIDEDKINKSVRKILLAKGYKIQ